MTLSYESMTQSTVGGWRVRVWVTEQDFRLGPRVEILDLILVAAAQDAINLPQRLESALRSWALTTGTNIAAYEIVDPLGNGAVAYVDWPK